jgi:hypothetical protein
MLDKETMKQLKQANVSKDAEKTKERVKALWKDLPKPQRDEIREMSGLSQHTIERAYMLGGIQAKLVVTFACLLKTDPFYIAGMNDKQRTYKDSLIVDFLTELGYTDIKTVTDKKPSKKQSAKLSNDKTDEPSSDPAPEKPSVVEKSGTMEDKDITEHVKPEKVDSIEKIVSEKPGLSSNDMPVDLTSLYASISKKASKDALQKIDELTEDECMLLLKGQFIQSGIDGGKQTRLSLIKYMLVQ